MTPLCVQVGGDSCGCESEADHGGVVQQVTGGGDLTMLNIPAGDESGELDPHGMSPVSDEVKPRLPPRPLHNPPGADGLGNPVGGLVFSNAFSGDGRMVQMHEWTNFMGACALSPRRSVSLC
jgi:hypothetical protein